MSDLIVILGRSLSDFPYTVNPPQKTSENTDNFPPYRVTHLQMSTIV